MTVWSRELLEPLIGICTMSYLYKKLLKMFVCLQMSPSDHEDENDPDGMFAFKRKKNCSYYAVS